MIFREIKPERLNKSPFKLIGSDWMLITAGSAKKYNMMTASWGGFGVLWNKNICFCVIRPGRYTYGFMEKSKKFTLSFFDKRYKSLLEFCGSNSGRDVDKTERTGLTPVRGREGAVYFKQASLVIICKKIYYQQIDPRRFLDPGIHKNYPKKDYHRMYVGQVVRCLIRSSPR